MSYNLTTNSLRTQFAKITSSKCFLGDFSKNKQIFLPPPRPNVSNYCP